MKSACLMTPSSARHWWVIWNGAVVLRSSIHTAARIRLTKTHPCQNGAGVNRADPINPNRRIQNKSFLLTESKYAHSISSDERSSCDCGNLQSGDTVEALDRGYAARASRG